MNYQVNTESYKKLKKDFYNRWKQPIQDLYRELESKLLCKIIADGVDGVWVSEDFPTTDYGYYISKVVFNESDEIVIYVGQRDNDSYTYMKANITEVSLKFFGSIIPTLLVDKFWEELIPLAETVGHPLLPLLKRRSITISEHYIIKSLLRL